MCPARRRAGAAWRAPGARLLGRIGFGSSRPWPASSEGGILYHLTDHFWVRRGDRAIEPSPLPGKVGSFPIEPEDVVRGLPWGGGGGGGAARPGGRGPGPGGATMVFMAMTGVSSGKSPYLNGVTIRLGPER